MYQITTRICTLNRILLNSTKLNSFTSFLMIALGLTACTPRPPYVPEPTKYNEDTTLMVNICNKFAFEPDAQKLHKAAVATESTRVIACTDFNEECSLYGEFLGLTIEVSADGNIDPTERRRLEYQLAKLKAAIVEGKEKLKQLNQTK